MSRTLALYGSPQWLEPIEVPGALPPCLCAGQLLLENGRRFGGCVRVAEGWILTAHHVIDIPDIARRFRVTFNHVYNSPLGVFEYRLDPDLGYFPSADGLRGARASRFDLDYVFVALAGPFPADDPSRANLPRISQAEPVAGSRAYIPQARDGHAMLRFPQENLESFPDGGRIAHVEEKYLFYRTSTQKGTSGAPVFDDDWNLVGLHTTGYVSALEHDLLRKNYNSGTRMSFILRDARERYPDFPDILPLGTGQNIALAGIP